VESEFISVRVVVEVCKRNWSNATIFPWSKATFHPLLQSWFNTGCVILGKSKNPRSERRVFFHDPTCSSFQYSFAALNGLEADWRQNHPRFCEVRKIWGSQPRSSSEEYNLFLCVDVCSDSRFVGSIKIAVSNSECITGSVV
jgi:hypothetical protein